MEKIMEEFKPITICEYNKNDKNEISQIADIWNEVVLDGKAFPQVEPLDMPSAEKFFAEQTFCGIAKCGDEVLGMYILHPNNVGRCGHICNASYAVASRAKGRKIGEMLVRHCIAEAPSHGFKILQFNAVVASNTVALSLYKKLGFVQLGTIPSGFLMPNGEYADIIPHYIKL